MCGDTGDLEEECEDALFELCDVRERYPAKCADELERCIHLTRRINMKPPKQNVIETLDDILITDDQKILFQDIMLFNKEKCKSWKGRDYRFEKMLSNINDLRTVMEQIKTAESCPINCMTKKK